MTPPLPGRRAAAILALPLAVSLASPFLAVTVAQPWHVAGESMEPGIEDGSVLLVDVVGPRLAGYHHGDVVILELPDEVPGDARLLVKRIVGLPGDHVAVLDGQLFLDGRPVVETYLGAEALPVPSGAPTTDLVVPAGTVFVMGDRRSNSLDSQAFGPIGAEQLVGRAWLALAPGGGMAVPQAVATGE